MRKIIIITLILLTNLVYGQQYIYRIKVTTKTDQGWVRDTIFCSMYHEAKNFKDTFQIFDYRIYAVQEKINGDASAIEKGQFRRKYYCFTNNQIKDTVKWLLLNKYNLQDYPARVQLISSP